jgi:hypothetical protein
MVPIASTRPLTLRLAVLLSLAAAQSPRLPADLVSRYTFDGTLEDAEPAANDATFFGGADAAFTEGYDGTFEGAVLFDGIDDYLRLTPVTGLPLVPNPAFTIAMWVKGPFQQNDRRIFSESSSVDNNPLFTLGTHNTAADGTLDSFIRVGGTISNHLHSIATVFDDTWHHIAWVDDNGAVTLYIDGVADGAVLSYPRPAFPLDMTTFGAVVRDSRAPPDCCWYAGALDEVRLYDHALSAQEVLELVPGGGCPEPAEPEHGDTHCGDLIVDGPAGGGPGLHTLTVMDAADDTGDPVLYSFRAESGQGNVLTAGPQPLNSVQFTLTQGTWTLTATVDDDPNCDDAAADAACTSMLEITCPEQGDTHCDDILVDGPAGETPGTYTVTALDAVDDSGDSILYTFRAENGIEPPLVVGPGPADFAAFTLGPGNWTLTATVDDDLLCSDEAADARCMRGIVIQAAPPALISRWTFDETLDDSQPAANHGAFFGDVAATYVDGFDGTPAGAIVFDGVDDHVAASQNAHLPIYAQGAYTVALWVKGLPNQVDRRVFSEGSTLAAEPLLNIGTHNAGTDGSVDIFIRGDNGQAAVAHRHSALVAFDDTWHHIAWVDDNGDAVLYVDAVRDSTDFRYARTRLTLNSTSIGGILRAAPSHWFAGQVDDVRVYNHALSLADVEALVPERAGCPGDADTTCTGLTVTPPAGNLPGLYLLNAVGAQDLTNDPLIYTFTAVSAGGGYLQKGPGPDDFAELRLTAGTWTLAVTVDDDLRCRDRAAGAVCSAQVTVVDPPRVLVSHWKFDGDLLDSGEAGNHGLFIGGVPAFVEDRNGDPAAALQFDGLDDFVQAQIVDVLPIYNNLSVTAYSIAMWVKGGPQPDRRVYSESTSDANNPLFNIGTQNTGATGQVDIFIRDAAGTAIVAHRLSQGIAFDDTWHHIAWVDEGGEAVLYIDGVRDGTDFNYPKPDMPFTITTIGGILRAAPCCLFRGALDDGRVYNYALSAEEVQEIIKGEPPGTLFVRGDTDSNGRLELTDPIIVLNFLFLGTSRPRCSDAADGDDNGRLELTDAVRVLNFLFLGLAAPPAPSPSSAVYTAGDCGLDPREEEPDLGCETQSNTCAS